MGDIRLLTQTFCPPQQPLCGDKAHELAGMAGHQPVGEEFHRGLDLLGTEGVDSDSCSESLAKGGGKNSPGGGVAQVGGQLLAESQAAFG